MIYFSTTIDGSFYFKELKGDTYKITELFKSSFGRDSSSRRDDDEEFTCSCDVKLKIETDAGDSLEFNERIKIHKSMMWNYSRQLYEAKRDYQHFQIRPEMYSTSSNIGNFIIISKDNTLNLNGEKLIDWVNEQIQMKAELVEKAIQSKKRKDGIENDFE